MSSYYLPSDVLNSVVLFNGCYGYNQHVAYQTKIDDFSKYIFKDLLDKQPELQKTHDDFIIALEKEQYANSLFSEMFDGKIKLENFIPQLFNQEFKYRGGDKPRISVFKFIFDEHPPFLNLMHEHITTKRHVSTIISETYFQLLKSKKADLTHIPSEEILKNIDLYSTLELTATSTKKKLNAYLNNFPKDEKLYEHIMKQLGKEIRVRGDIKNYWEEKLKLFPDNIQKKYKDANNYISPFAEEETYYYRFKMNPQFVVQEGKVSQKLAEEFTYMFHNALCAVIDGKYTYYGKLAKFGESESSYTFESEKDREQVTKFCELIKQNITSMVQGYPFNKDYAEKQKYLDKSLETFYFKYNLEQDLPSKDSTEPPRKNKI